MKQKIERAAAFIKEHVKETPKIGLILGSGLGVLADEIEGAVKLTYETIPDF
ncbi:purine-nucleoside phosphorylase, partial [Bacillus velezensis]